MSDVFGFGALGGAAISAGVNYGINQMNNEEAERREMKARWENYMYNERAADNADTRTRSLYMDLYSPQAQLEQLKSAGLSPSLFYGDGGGISGQSGAQGAGAGGISPTVYGMSPVDFTQLGLIAAQTALTRAETKKVTSETKQVDLKNEIDELKNSQFKTEFTITNTHFLGDDGSETSLFEIASSAKSYEQFTNNVRELANSTSNVELRDATTTEAGQDVLRNIYESSNKLQRNISVLSSEKVDAEFQEQIAKCLQKEDFAKLNAKQACAELKRATENANLDETQKKAWNELLDKLPEGTFKNVIIVMAMLLDRYTSHIQAINYKSGNRQQNIINGEK